MNAAGHLQHDPPGTAWTTRLGVALCIGASFWFVSHSLLASKKMLAGSVVAADRIENIFAVRERDTTTSSAVGYFVLGGLGMACWACSASGKANWRHPLVFFCLAYVGWCAFSWTWSAAPELSTRKLAILFLMLAGAFGLASRYELEDVAWMAVLTLGGLVVIGVLAEIAQGAFRPWRSDYRFAGTVHPNDQGLQCALLALLAGFATWERRDRPWVRYALVSLGLAGLALSKSRTTLAALVAAAALALVLRSRGMQRWLIVSACIVAACVVGFASSFATVSALDQTADVAAMGRLQNLNSLTGRLPLWHELWKAAEDNVVAGHGFGGFWSSDSVLKYSKIFKWQIPHAHNAYLDLVLSVGVIGAVLYVTWLLATMAVATARHERSGRASERLVVCFIAFSLVHGVTESKFPGSGIGGFLLLVVLATLAIRPPSESGTPELSTTPLRREPRPFANRMVPRFGSVWRATNASHSTSQSSPR